MHQYNHKCKKNFLLRNNRQRLSQSDLKCTNNFLFLIECEKTMRRTIAVLPGDGIGNEVMREALKVLVSF